MNERQTKTWTGANVADVREVSPKIFKTKGDHDPIKYYEMYKSKRPLNFCDAEDPIYIGWHTLPNMVSSSESRREKMGSIVITMKIEGGLDENKCLTNHSARKYLVQKLR